MEHGLQPPSEYTVGDMIRSAVALMIKLAMCTQLSGIG